MVIHSSYGKKKLKVKEEIEEIKGKLESNFEENKLLHSILEAKNTNEGRLIKDAINQGLHSFIPDLIFENIVKNYSQAKVIYGESFLRQLIGNENGINIPEFQRELKKKIKQIFESMKQEKLLDKNYEITDKGIELASISLCIEELDNLQAKGLIGDKVNKKLNYYGDEKDFRKYKKGDRYKDLKLGKSVSLAIKRGHKKIQKEDLVIAEREGKGRIYIIYALDASGSMKGEKIDLCKKAGVALAFKAINEKNKVGLLVFGSNVHSEVQPTSDFNLLLKSIVTIRAKNETNIAETIMKSIGLFPDENVTRHLTLITDAMPTTGKEPIKETLDAVAKAAHLGITISIIGINLGDEGKKLGEQIAYLGNGKFYIAKNLEDIDTLVLEDYYNI